MDYAKAIVQRSARQDQCGRMLKAGPGTAKNGHEPYAIAATVFLLNPECFVNNVAFALHLINFVKHFHYNNEHNEYRVGKVISFEELIELINDHTLAWLQQPI